MRLSQFDLPFLNRGQKISKFFSLPGKITIYSLTGGKMESAAKCERSQFTEILDYTSFFL